MSAASFLHVHDPVSYATYAFGDFEAVIVPGYRLGRCVSAEGSGGLSSGVIFSSPLNPGNLVHTDASGAYTMPLFADGNFTATADVETPGQAAIMDFAGLPVGTLDHSQTCNLTLPTAQLTISVQNASGHPITGGVFRYDTSSVNPIPGLPGITANTFIGNAPALDPNGNLTLPLPVGITLSNGLTIGFTLHPITADGLR